jgi:hypothetical protein
LISAFVESVVGRSRGRLEIADVANEPERLPSTGLLSVSLVRAVRAHGRLLRPGSLLAGQSQEATNAGEQYGNRNSVTLHQRFSFA